MHPRREDRDFVTSGFLNSDLDLLREQFATLKRYSKLPLHTGKASLTADQDISPLHADVLVPAEDTCLILLQGQIETIPYLNMGQALTVAGESPDGPFKLSCPQFRSNGISKLGSKPGWAVISPTNTPMVITYEPPRPVTSVNAIINNFDFVIRDTSSTTPATTNNPEQTTLRVEASGRIVDFAHRTDREQLHLLTEAEILSSAAFSTFSFSAWDGARDADLTEFALNIASLCTYAVGQQTGIPVLSFLDKDGHVVKRVIRNPVESKFRPGGILNDSRVPDGISRLFRQCFDEHVRMRNSSLPWKKLASYCANIEDPPYLEQKFATLMIALEFFIKNCLIEAGHLSSDQAKKMQLPDLIGKARKMLGWDIQKHYSARKFIFTLRNAVMHGGELPTKDSVEFRQTFDKWKLFLYRRVLIRLGYDGPVSSPQNGWASLSAVNDFSEEHNTFA